MPLANITK